MPNLVTEETLILFLFHDPCHKTSKHSLRNPSAATLTSVLHMLSLPVVNFSSLYSSFLQGPSSLLYDNTTAQPSNSPADAGSAQRNGDHDY